MDIQKKATMKVDDNKTFMLFWNSMHSFKSARSIIDMIYQQKLGEQDPRTAVLFGAITGYYAAPFMRTNNLGQLCDSVVPSQYEDLHNNLRTLRDKIFLHLDKGVDFDGRKDVTSLRVSIAKNVDDVKMEAKSWTPTQTILAEIRELLDHLIQVLHNDAMAYVQKHVCRACIVPGEYRLKVDGNQFELEPDK